MSIADSDKITLKRLQDSLVLWDQTFKRDPLNQALGVCETLQEDLLDIRRVRWYSLAGIAGAEDLWRRHVECEGLTGEVREGVLDYYMNGATFIMLNTPMAHASQTSFIRHLCESLTWVNRSPLVPTHIREYALGFEDFVKLVSDNHWILFMILLSITPLAPYVESDQ